MASVDSDVAIVGAGPAGLAVAIGARLLNLNVHIFDRNEGPIDKACGEGLMPSGLRELEKLGVLRHLDRAETSPFHFIEYINENGTRAKGALPTPGGFGIRRLALSAAMRSRALELGVVFHEKTSVRNHQREVDGMRLTLDDGIHKTLILVAADGLHSACRKRESFKENQGPVKRFGLRRHIKLPPWSQSVEVHFAKGIEAYVTPAGVNRVGIAFLWENRFSNEKVSFEQLLAHFPLLKEKIAAADFDSTPRGAGALWQQVSKRVAPRFVLVGDAAGYVDAITGEGLTQAFMGAAALVTCLPDAIRLNGALGSFQNYEKKSAAEFARYSRLARALLLASRQQKLRGHLVQFLSTRPTLFARILSIVL